MLLHNLFMAVSQLTKYKLQTLLSLIGLAVGFTCFALSSLWWRYETTYDSFHPEAENLYVQVISPDKWATARQGTVSGATTSSALEKIPQVEQVTLFKHTTISVNGVGTWLCVVDSMFLPTLQPELVAGAYPQMNLDDASVVVTNKLAMKLFGTTDCIGREVKLENKPSNPKTFTGKLWQNGTYTVAAVVKDWGKHTLFPFDCIVPYKREQMAKWQQGGFSYTEQTIMRLHPTAHPDTVSALINRLTTSAMSVETRIVRLSSFRTEFPNANTHLVKVEHIRTFSLLGLIVVVCAVFNYLSLYVIRIRMRARELALRLVCGSSRRQLLWLLITEFFLLLFASCMLGMLFFGLSLPEFREITRIEEEDSYFFIEMGLYMLAVSLCTLPLLVGVTWWMQRQSLNEVLGKGMAAVRRNLFLPLSQWLQLAVGMGLVFFTSVIILQLHHLRNSTVAGFIYENRAVYSTWQNPEQTTEMVHYLRHHTDVVEVKPGYNQIKFGNITQMIYDGNGMPAKSIELREITRSEAEFWGLELLEGRWMEDNETGVAVANESAVEYLNLKHPVDTFVDNLHLHIKGVVRNVCAKSFIVPQEPTLYEAKSAKQMARSEERYISFSYRPGSWPALSDSICTRFNASHYGSNIGGEEFFITNTEEDFNRLLHSEDTLLGLFYVITAVCILIALFGVYSLMTISCEQRRKEIAVRKVFGAKVGDILHLFFSEQLVVLLLAALAGFPVAYVCVKPWLEGYIHQVEIPLWLCPAIFMAVALLVSLCIGWRVWRTANAHPADEICKG